MPEVACFLKMLLQFPTKYFVESSSIGFNDVELSSIINLELFDLCTYIFAHEHMEGNH